MLVLAAGAVFRVPFPVQPLKAADGRRRRAGAVAGRHPAAGLEIAAFLLVLSIAASTDVISRAFTTPSCGALQFAGRCAARDERLQSS